MKKIDVQYVGDELTTYIWVRPVPKPETGGHKALKNEDFIDHDDLILRNSYYKQVVEKRLRDRYLARVTNPAAPSPEEVASNKAMGIGRHHSIPQVEDKPLTRIPIIED